MSIKLVAIDVDGTLINNDHNITHEVSEAVKKTCRTGVKVVISTGRPITGVQNILKELQLNEPGNYVIAFNGGLIQDTATQKEIIQHNLSYEEYLEIEYTSRTIGIHMHAITKRNIYTTNRNIGKYTVYESHLANMPLLYRTPDEMASKEIIKIMYVDEPKILNQAFSQLPPHFHEKYTVIKSTPFYLEFLPQAASKGTAIRYVAQKFGLKKEQIMAIGDEENDRSMLEVAGLPVVMANGNPELKKIAKYITKSNQESGVAHALRKWVLI